MADTKVTIINIEVLCVFEPTIFFDVKGSLFEFYNDEVFASYGLNLNFVQDNEPESKKGVFLWNTCEYQASTRKERV